MSEASVNVRYIVGDVQASVDWYVGHFGFEVQMNAAPAFASVEKGALRLLLSGRTSSAGRAMPDGELPVAGGWNRFQVIVEDIDAEYARLKARGVRFRNEVLSGPGGSQVLALDPSGNLVELFQPGARG